MSLFIVFLLWLYSQVSTYIEDCVAQKDPLIKILRLVCMQSVCNNGLKQKVLDFYKREILQVGQRKYLWMHNGEFESQNFVQHSVTVCGEQRWIISAINIYSSVCFVGLDVWLQAHSNSQELGKGWATQTSKHHEKQLPHNQENPQTVDGGYQWTGLSWHSFLVQISVSK